ncbi:3-oxoacyl-[acyl-carrier protein] reductase [Chitinophaga niastensis]|uniref:3-oxoacyl-[acyl-carrier protein] reductase n=1 Tax=Chitinophaga niastensis TaxID=536980 RepID=A0A2P8HK18_CHINA|nr:SDR family oxidoreductase [Chitinophaga niastensis]PSL46568.1 3-oxoacyl-[acyl-carrier protein] reductase [Chitinophaga niastensis]
MDLGLSAKTILITGGSKGIGEATAMAFAKEPGTQVAITYFQGKTQAESIVDKINAAGGKAMAVYMELGNHPSIIQAVEEVVQAWGQIDVLVNNAIQWGNAEYRGKHLEEIPISAWEYVINTNLFSLVKLTQLVLPYMRNRNWGRIVNISSDLAFDSMKGSGAYSALKASLLGLTANLVEEYSPYNILTNTVVPSWTQTEKALQYFPASLHEAMKQAFPTGRITQPEDVANTILFLCSAANGHVNGETIRVTGKGAMPLMNHVIKGHMAAAK